MGAKQLVGALVLEVVKGNNIKTGSTFVPSPYVVVNFHDEPSMTSSCRQHTRNPVWNETVTLDLATLDADVEVSVWDKNHEGSGGFLGKGKVSLRALNQLESTFHTIKLEATERGTILLKCDLKLHGDATSADHNLKEGAVDLARMNYVLTALKTEVLETLQELSGEDPAEYVYASHARHPLYPDVDLENLPKRVDKLHMSQVLPPGKLGRLTARVTEYLYSQSGYIERAQETKDRFSAVYAGYVKPMQTVLDFWKDDVEFCRQLTQGVNPLVIALCEDEYQVPDSLRQLSAQGRSVSELIEERELFILDYALLDGIPQYRDMFVYAPICLVYREKIGTTGSRLNMLGFQLTRKFDGSDEVFVPESATPCRYLFGKMHLACADNQYHQWISHLGGAHLAMEPFAIAHHNAFPPGHPIGDILRPHFEDTIGINYLAGETLFSPTIPFTDRTFSLGTVGGLWLFLKSYRNWNFEESAFPAQLKARGFDEEGSDGLEDYFYRDDGFLVWNGLKEYFSDIVHACYDNDALVAADSVLDRWCAESVDPKRADVMGFPKKIAAREHLVEVLTTIVFSASAYHSAVNLPQHAYISYVPNRPNALFAPMPESREEITWDYVAQALPDFNTTQFQALFSWLLSMPSDRPLSELTGSAKLFPEIQAKHKLAFQEISKAINNRNADRETLGKIPYPFLDPNQVASSVDI